MLVISDGTVAMLADGDDRRFSGNRALVTITAYDKKAYEENLNADLEEVPLPEPLSEHGPMRFGDALDAARHGNASDDVVSGLDEVARRLPGNDWTGVLNPLR